MLNFNVSDPQFNNQVKAVEALYQVIDPELFVNIIDLGLVYDIQFPDETNIDVLMTLSTPHCPMGEAITNGVQNALEQSFPGKTVKVNLTFEPAWNFEMLTEEGRKQLGVA